MIGVGPGEDTPMETEDSEAPIKQPPPNKYYIDTTVIGRPREGVEMKTPLKDGISKGHCSLKCVYWYLFI